MPPSKSGIADYSLALVEEMSKRADVSVFSGAQQHFDPTAFERAWQQALLGGLEL